MWIFWQFLSLSTSQPSCIHILCARMYSIRFSIRWMCGFRPKESHLLKCSNYINHYANYVHISGIHSYSCSLSIYKLIRCDLIKITFVAKWYILHVLVLCPSCMVQGTCRERHLFAIFNRFRLFRFVNFIFFYRLLIVHKNVQSIV